MWENAGKPTNTWQLSWELGKCHHTHGRPAVLHHLSVLQRSFTLFFSFMCFCLRVISIFYLLQMQNLTNIILFPAENILKTELRGSKGDLKRPFDRAWRDYHDRYSELERTKKKQAKEAGMIRSELTAGEIAEDLEKERKYLQIATADYMIKVNEIKTKKGVELLSHFMDYYHAQSRYTHN